MRQIQKWQEIENAEIENYNTIFKMQKLPFNTTKSQPKKIPINFANIQKCLQKTSYKTLTKISQCEHFPRKFFNHRKMSGLGDTDTE